MPSNPARLIHRGSSRLLRAAAMALLLGGCVANSSNPIVTLREARMSAKEAVLDLEVANPGGRDLCVKAIEYQLSHGETAMPVADGVWKGEVELPARKSVCMVLRVPFAIEPLEPDSRRLHLNGTLRLEDRTGYLGLGFMDMTGSPFQVEADAKEQSP
jgi:hypothetical protein